MSEPGEVTQLLRAWRDGDKGAFAALVPIVYQDMRRIAAGHIVSENPGLTLSPTGLLHESFLKLMQSGSPPDWQDRRHFFVVASRAMRQLLVDHARKRRSLKRSPVEESTTHSGDLREKRLVDAIDIDRLLDRLETQAPRRARMLELKYFGGLGVEEIGEAVECSASTVSRELKLTEAWMARELRSFEGGLAT